MGGAARGAPCVLWPAQGAPDRLAVDAGGIRRSDHAHSLPDIIMVTENAQRISQIPAWILLTQANALSYGFDGCWCSAQVEGSRSRARTCSASRAGRHLSGSGRS